MLGSPRAGLSRARLNTFVPTAVAPALGISSRWPVPASRIVRGGSEAGSKPAASADRSSSRARLGGTRRTSSSAPIHVGPWSVIAHASPDVADGEALRERVGRVDDVLGDPGDPGLPADLRYDGRATRNAGLLEQPSGERRPEDRLVHVV